MKMTELGRTGLRVSRLCFGALTVGPLQADLSPLEGGRVLARAVELGVNFVDTAQLYGSYAHIREGMRLSGRDDLVISTKTYAYTRGLAREAVEQARRELDRDVIDIFMLHEQESVHTLRGHREALDYLYDCKARGIVRAVGASMHHVAAVRGAVELGLDVIHPLLNLEGLGIVDGGREEMEQAVRKAHAQGMGVFSMKPLGGGNLFRQAPACLDYALGLDCVDSVAIGMQSPEEAEANAAYWERGRFSSGQQAVLDARTRRLHIEGWCEGCGACVKRCGQGALRLERERAVCEHSRCLLCGYCAGVCPAWAIKVV